MRAVPGCRGWGWGMYGQGAQFLGGDFQWAQKPGLGHTAEKNLSPWAGEVAGGGASSDEAGSPPAPQPHLCRHTVEVLSSPTTLGTMLKSWNFDPLFLVAQVRGHWGHRIRDNTPEPLSRSTCCHFPGHLFMARGL